MADWWSFSGGNLMNLLEQRTTHSTKDMNYRLQSHSSLIQRLRLEGKMEGHEGCVNCLNWNKNGSFLISGSDDLHLNIWNYEAWLLSGSIDTGHRANIFCTRFMPETGDEVVASGAGDAEVRLFNLPQASDRRAPEPMAIFRCHSRRVKKLAVEPGNPNVIWSASEDGTLRQHDLREGSCCPPSSSLSQECHNILLDLRSGSKKSLADSPKHLLALKSCDISPIRPHELLIGGSDAFGRLYDRRMLPSMSSSRTKTKSPSCVTYFCPVHLSERQSSSLHLTHVTFSPNGEELLMNYSGEHVYLMNVNRGGNSAVRYSAGEILEKKYLPAALNGLRVASKPNPAKATFPKRLDNGLPERFHQIASYALENDGEFLLGIEACCQVLDGSSRQIDDALKHDFLCIRAALFLKRNWKNDVHMAIRDCHAARDVDFVNYRSYYYLAEALKQLGQYENALDYALAAEYLSPLNPDVTEQVASIKEHITRGLSSKENREASSSSRVSGRRTLSDVLFLPDDSDGDGDGDGNGDGDDDGDHAIIHSDREDSDYDEMELDIVTSISGDDDHDDPARRTRRSLNVIFQRDLESIRDNGHVGRSNGSTSSSNQKDSDDKPDFAVDMKQRYVGHCNLGTDIKQASFIGRRGEFIASGSDDGRWFIWEKTTGRLIKILVGDETVVNCIQCHPTDCSIATSGIDNTIKMWTPDAETSSIMGGNSNSPVAADVLSVISRNQKKLMRTRGFLPFEFLERIGLPGFPEENLQPLECVQS